MKKKIHEIDDVEIEFICKIRKRCGSHGLEERKLWYVDESSPTAPRELHYVVPSALQIHWITDPLTLPRH
jgi:hypothetical protein